MMARAICWTLVHSLWQGMLAAVLAGIIILWTRKSRPALRHNLLAAVLLLFLGVAGVTFMWQFRQTAVPPAAVDGIGQAAAMRVTERSTADLVGSSAGRESTWKIIQSSTVMQRITVEVNQHAATVALLWMVFLFGQMIRMTAGLYRVGRIRRHGKLPPTNAWMEKLAVLAAQLGIKRRVSLLQTGSVSVPAVIGLLKPAILLPLGMLAHLPPDQLETVLLHELAHIKRNDLLTNLLLHLAEIVFFFNPGFRWLCALIRREREACCDDIVLQRTPDKTTYFEALVAFQQFAVGGRKFALQLAGGRTDLLWRMKRMLSEENKKLQLMEKTFLSFGVVALVAIGLLSMKTGDKQTPQSGDKQMVQGGDKQMVQSASKETPNAAGIHPMVVKNPKADTIPGASPKAKTANPRKREFPSITMNIDNDEKRITMEATDMDGNKYFFQKINNKITKISINGKVIPQEEYDKYLYLFDEAQAEWDEATRPAVPATPAEISVVATPAKPAGVSVVGMLAKPVIEPDLAAPAAPPPAYDFCGNIVRDLLADAIIQSDDPVSFTLDNNGFVVNGTKQPDSVYQKFKVKFVKSPEDHFIYSHEGKGSHSDVWVKSYP